MERYASGKFRMFFVTLLLSSLVSLTGCVARMPVDSEAQAIRSGKKSIVLFRVTTTPNKDSEPYKRLNDVDWKIWKLDNSPNPENISAKLNNPFRWSTAWRVPSDTSGKEGWRYLVFDPGNYTIKMIPENVSHESEDDSPGRKEAYYQFPIYRLSIPRGRPLLYAGSFELKRYAESYRGFFSTYEKNIRYESSGVLNEIELAKQIGKEALSAFGDVTPDLMVPYEDLQASVSNVRGRRITAVESLPSAKYHTKGVGASAQVVAAPLVAGSLLMMSVADSYEDDDNNLNSNNNSKDELSAVVAGLALMIAAVPVAVAADKTFGAAARKKWAPHEEALKREIAAFKLDEQLTNLVTAQLQLPDQATSTNAEAAFVLQLQPYRICLHETQHGKFALEVAVCFRLLEAASRRSVWENNFVYSDWDTLQNKKSFSGIPYETLIKCPSLPHPLDQYKGDTGVALFRSELNNAVSCLSQEIRKRLREAGF